MIGVGEDDASAELLERVLRQSFDGSGGTDRHECRSFECAMRRREFSSARAGWVGLGNLEREAHLYIVVRTSFPPNSPQTSPICVSPTGIYRRTSVAICFDLHKSREHPSQHRKEQNKREPCASDNSECFAGWNFFR